jgi:hypothetical protein
MGMKVAAVATLCQDERVFVAMLNAGTPCPINGKIGVEARKEWDQRDLARVQGADKIGDTGFYAAPINIQPETKETKSDQSSCTGYTGDDPVVKNRIGC